MREVRVHLCANRNYRKEGEFDGECECVCGGAGRDGLRAGTRSVNWPVTVGHR